MAGAKDIRRETADVSPNNYIRPGVQDNSLAAGISGLGGVAIKLDKELAKERFGEALETLRSEYMVSNPVSGDMQDEEGDDDVDVGSALTGEDKRQLADFEEVLRTNDAAVAQGRMSMDAFRLRAERLYRMALSKRPGMAQEFREVAANLLGRDVVGASLDILAETEREMAAARAASAKSARDLAIDDEKMKRQILKENDILVPPDIGLGDPRFKSYFQEIFPTLSARVQSQAALKLANAQVEMTDATSKANLPAATAQWAAQAAVVRSDIAVFGDQLRTHLKAMGPNPDPAQVRAAIQAADQKLDAEVVKLEAAAAGGSVEPAVVAREMARIEGSRARLKDVLSGSDDKTIAADAISLIEGETTLALYNDEEFKTMAVLLDTLPPTVAPLLLKRLDKSMALMAARALTGNVSPEALSRNAENIAGGVIGAVFPRGSATPPDPVAVEKLSDLLNAGAQSFYLVNDGQFRLENFTGSVGKPGFMQTLALQLTTLQRGMSTEQKTALAQHLAAGTANAVRVAGAALFQEAPRLKGNVEFDFSPEDGRVFRQKPGVVLAAQDALILGKYNRAFNSALIGRVIGGLAGGDSTAAWGMVKDSYAPVLEARKSRPKEGGASGVAGNTTGGSTGSTSGSQGHQGPVTRWWE